MGSLVSMSASTPAFVRTSRAETAARHLLGTETDQTLRVGEVPETHDPRRVAAGYRDLHAVAGKDQGFAGCQSRSHDLGHDLRIG